MKRINTLSVALPMGVLLLAAQAWADTTEAPEGSPAVRLESVIVGDKEQPAVSYFVPWQGTRTPDRLQWNMDRKHDTTLSPVDREVLRRSVTVYEQMDLEHNADH
jgi:hypothetical protein